LQIFPSAHRDIDTEVSLKVVVGGGKVQSPEARKSKYLRSLLAKATQMKL